MTVNALLVEDDEYKIDSLRAVLPKNYQISIARSVSSAVRTVVSNSFDVVFLDMALPTFEKRAGSASGSSQPQGGVEVLRALKFVQKKMKVVIISQYSGVEVDGIFVKLEQCAPVFREKYAIDVVGAVAYDFEDDKWKIEFLKVMAKL